MRALLWTLLGLCRLVGLRIVYLTVDGRPAYDRVRKAVNGTLDRSTDGETFRWRGCRFGYEPSPEDFITADPDGSTCSYCGDPWKHSLTRVDSKGRTVPDRTPADRCETCARKVAERRGVPWETVR